jgi:hypothetical protein
MMATQARATSAYLKWSEAAITFDRSDHANHIQPPGRFPLVASATVGETRLTKVLMDGESGLNVLYLRTYNAMGLSRVAIWPTSTPIYGVIPRARASPLRQVTLPITFEGCMNFCTEALDFEVINLPSAYQAILG